MFVDPHEISSNISGVVCAIIRYHSAWSCLLLERKPFSEASHTLDPHQSKTLGGQCLWCFWWQDVASILLNLARVPPALRGALIFSGPRQPPILSYITPLPHYPPHLSFFPRPPPPHNLNHGKPSPYPFFHPFPSPFPSSVSFSFLYLLFLPPSLFPSSISLSFFPSRLPSF